jgi:hypothetical protein
MSVCVCVYVWVGASWVGCCGGGVHTWAWGVVRVVPPLLHGTLRGRTMDKAEVNDEAEIADALDEVADEEGEDEVTFGEGARRRDEDRYVKSTCVAAPPPPHPAALPHRTHPMPPPYAMACALRGRGREGTNPRVGPAGSAALKACVRCVAWVRVCAPVRPPCPWKPRWTPSPGRRSWPV